MGLFRDPESPGIFNQNFCFRARSKNPGNPYIPGIRDFFESRYFYPEILNSREKSYGRAMAMPQVWDLSLSIEFFI